MILNYIKIFINKWWPLLVILISASTSLFWLPSNHIFSFGLNFPLPPGEGIIQIIKVHIFSWVGLSGFGNQQYDTTTALYYAILGLLAFLTGSVHYAESLFLYINYVGIIGGMYALCRTLNINRSASLFAGFFYLLTPFIATGMPMSPIGLRVLPFYVFLPLTTAVLIRALNSQNLKMWCFFGIVSSLSTISFSSLQYFLIQNMIHFCIICFTYMGFMNKPIKFDTFIPTLSKFTGIILLCNSYWMLPLFRSFNSYFLYRSEPLYPDATLLEGTAFSILNGFRFLPYPLIQQVYSWGGFYFEPLPTLLALSFSFLAIAALFNREKQKITIPFAFILIISLFLGKGTNPPLESLGDLLLLSSPYVTRLLRNLTYFEIPIIFASAVLIAIGIHGIRVGLKDRVSKKYGILFVSTLMILSIGIYGMPFFSGVIMEDKYHTKIPDYYLETAEFLNDDNSMFRILSIPTFSSQDSYVSYDWGNRYYGQQILHIWSGKPAIRAIYPIGMTKPNPIIQSIMTPTSPFNDSELVKLHLWNVKYITLHNDFDWEYIWMINSATKEVQPESLNEFVEYYQFEKVASFDKIEIFKVPDDNFLPYIYPATIPVLINGSAKDMFQTVTFENFSIENSVFFPSDFMNEEQIQFIRELDNTALDDNVPEITFQKMNPTRYTVHLNASKPFFLIFSESYHPKWKVYIEEKTPPFNEITTNYENVNVKEAKHENVFTPRDLSYLFDETLPEENHFIANGYMNTWYLDPKVIDEDGDGYFTVTLYFDSQNEYYIGFIVSMMAFFGLIVGVGKDYLKIFHDRFLKNSY